MKEIKAIIRPEMFETVYSKLRSEGYCCLSVYSGEGVGRQGDPEKMNASLEFPFLHSKVTKIEIVVDEPEVEEVMRIIRQAACTNSAGDGIMYSTPIDKVVSIRTGKSGKIVL
ncbi:MAG: P-II family nitrogen regulator [Cyclonatronaceae bacterium]